MSFLHRLASGIKEGFVSMATGGETPSRKHEPPHRNLSKQSSRGRSRPTSVSLGYLEEHIRDAIAAFVQDKFEKGEAKPHVFTQFWLQFPKLEAGFEVLRRQLEARTGSREGPLPVAVLRAGPREFGIAESSAVLRELCSRAGSANKCTDIDFVGLVMLLLVVKLTEPAPTGGPCPLHDDVRTMLSCLELAFTHFNSARKGKLDKREVAEALQYESAKAHTREGARGRTSNRLAHRLFEGLDWEHDNTISFENFLRGILQLVQDEFGDVSDEEGQQGEDASVSAHGGGGGRSTAAATASGTPSPPPESATAGGQPNLQRRCGSARPDSSSKDGSTAGGRNRPRSSSATGMTSGGPDPGPPASESVPRSPSGLMAALRNSFRKSTDVALPVPGEVPSSRGM